MDTPAVDYAARAQDAHESARRLVARRDADLARAVSLQGLSYREAARRVGLSHAQVINIVKREREKVDA